MKVSNIFKYIFIIFAIGIIIYAGYRIYNNNKITLYNAGDILMPSRWRLTIIDTPQTISLTCGSLNLTLTDIMRDSSPT